MASCNSYIMTATSQDSLRVSFKLKELLQTPPPPSSLSLHMLASCCCRKYPRTAPDYLLMVQTETDDLITIYYDLFWKGKRPMGKHHRSGQTDPDTSSLSYSAKDSCTLQVGPWPKNKIWNLWFLGSVPLSVLWKETWYDVWLLDLKTLLCLW